jgi:hypothetical protein
LKPIWFQSGGSNLAIWREAQSGPVWQSKNNPNLVNLEKALNGKEKASAAIWRCTQSGALLCERI